MSRLIRFSLLLLGFAVLAPVADAQKFEDNRFGYELLTPRDWDQVPIKANEEYIIAKFLSKKTHFFTDPDLKLTYEHKPEIQVIAFLSEKYRKDEVEREESENGDTVTIRFNLTNPFKDYEDFLKNTYSGGGFYIAEQSDDEIGGLEVTQYLVKVEKGANGPKRITTWVFKTGDIDFAVQIECFESAWKELRGDITRTLKSFEEIERTEGSIVQDASTGGIELTIGEMTPEQRKKRRQDRERDFHKKAISTLPEDWEVLEEKHFVVLNHADKKDAQKLIEQGDAVFAWCEKSFPYLVDKNDYLSRPVIRICKDWDELASFAFGGAASGWIPTNDMATYKDTVGIGSNNYSNMTQRFASFWINEHDSDFLNAMPTWMRYGLEYNMAYAKHKGTKLELYASDWERMGLRAEVKAGTAHTPREMFMAEDDFYDAENSRYEAAALMRYLLAGKGAKDKLTKTVIRDYYLNMSAVLEEMDERDDTGNEKAPETEEEEAEMVKARAQRLKDQADEIREAAFQRTFGEWTDKDWASFEKNYFKSID